MRSYCKEWFNFWCSFIHLFVRVFICAGIRGDDEEIYSIPVEYWNILCFFHLQKVIYRNIVFSVVQVIDCHLIYSWPLLLLHILLSFTSLISHAYYWFLFVLPCLRLWAFHNEKHDISICSQCIFILFACLNILLSLRKITKRFYFSSLLSPLLSHSG